MDQTLFDDLQQTIKAEGPAPALEKLCSQLREQKDYANLFYAMLMKKRFELGVTPLPTAPSSELPSSVLDKYEEGIREAGRLVGRLFLEQGDLPQAFSYFKMLGEVEPVTAALEKYQLPEGEGCQPIIELAFYHGGNPRRGYEWILERFGICSAITIMSGALQGGNFPHGAEARDQCLKQLVRALHQQLLERIRFDITRREGQCPETRSVPELIAGRDWLFEEDNYHVDVSHLSSVVQMSVHLPKCEELNLVREMCQYGKHLSAQFRGQGEPPFDDLYVDYSHYYNILAGEQLEEGLAQFRKKAENPDPDYSSNHSAELLVNTYLKLNRPADALATARRFLANANERDISCPGITELCRRVNDYQTLAEVARERGDPVNFVAGLLAARNPPKANGQ
jgi:hypothetical protein